MALGWLGPDWPPARKWRGVMIEYACAEPIACDITQRCFDCGTIIIDRRHHQVIHGPHVSVEALGHRGFYRMHGIDLLAEAEFLRLESIQEGIL